MTSRFDAMVAFGAGFLAMAIGWIAVAAATDEPDRVISEASALSLVSVIAVTATIVTTASSGASMWACGVQTTEARHPALLLVVPAVLALACPVVLVALSGRERRETVHRKRRQYSDSRSLKYALGRR